MAIKKDEKNSSKGEIAIKINNGDLEALKQLQALWKLKDIESVLIFAVGVLRSAKNTKGVFITKEDYDKPVPVSPGEQLIMTPSKGDDDSTEQVS